VVLLHGALALFLLVDFLLIIADHKMIFYLEMQLTTTRRESLGTAFQMPQHALKR
jgi:uncharacterized membrane protein